jgi:hypothetical protein
MTSNRRQAATLALAALAFAMACGALFIVGGPETARAERRDDLRIDTIRNVAECLKGLPKEVKDALPDMVSEDLTCPSADNRKDPLTGEPYRIEKRGAGFVAVCARFELPDRLNNSYERRFNRNTGCFEAN